jgi:hypothetical protein
LLFAPMNQVSHSASSLLTGWLLTNVLVNNMAALHDTCMDTHTYIQHIIITILSLLYTSSTPFGRPDSSDPSHLTQYGLQKGACYKTVCVTKRYMLQNNMCKTTVGITKWFTYKTICVTKWYLLQNGTSQAVHVT